MLSYQVRHRYLASKQRSSTTRRSSGFKNLLWEFNVNEIDAKCSQITQSNDIHYLHKEGFDNLHVGFEEFLRENKLTYSMMMILDILRYIQVQLLNQLILFEQQESSMVTNGLVMQQFLLKKRIGMERYIDIYL